MKKLLLIVRSNLRKAKGQTVAIIVLVFFAALLLNLGLMLSMDYHENFDRYHDQLNAEHVTLAVQDNDDSVRELLSRTLTADNRVTEYRLDRCWQMIGTLPYNGGEMTSELVFLDKDTALTRTIGRSEIVEEGNLSSGIYLPMLYKSGDVAVGKTVEISIGTIPVKYTVCGFFNNVMTGSHNCALTQIILTPDKYVELQNLGYASTATLCSVRLKNIADNQSFESEIKATLSEHFPQNYMVSNSYDIVSQSRYIAQGICSIILVIMAFIVLLIAVVVIASNIVNYIQVNMKNLGALKSVGYTSWQLIAVLLIQFLSLTLFASIVGAGLSYCVFPALNTMMMAQTGIPYTMHFLPLPLFIALLILSGSITLSVWLAARRIKKIEPIVALRSGIQTHNFKSNHVPLEKTKVPLNLAMALKTTLTGMKHNVTIFVTMVVLSLVVVFSGLMTENAIADIDPFLDLIMGESTNSCVYIDPQIEDEFLQVMDADNRVEKVYLYNSINVVHNSGEELTAMICDDFAKVNNQSVVYEGRFPKYANEIAIAGKYAQAKGLKIGNEIEIKINGKIEKYLISGFTQISNYLGRDCLLTRAGYERLGTFSSICYYINLTPDTDIDVFNNDVKTKFDGKVNSVVNANSIIDAAASVYVSLLTIIVIAILVLSVLIIAFVLYLLVRTMLNNKIHDYGILKAIGFTTKQLILQTALSFMPAIILSTIVGLTISCLVINPLMSVFLGALGIVKCTFNIPVAFSVIMGGGLILLSFGITCLLSLKIKNIAPRNLLVGE